MDFNLFMKGALRWKMEMADKLLDRLPEKARDDMKAFGAKAASAIVEAFAPYAEASPAPASGGSAPRKVDIG
jgi:hypothetical protein